MDDILLVDAAERYYRDEMTQEERTYFEEIRKNNPELDQLVVEHIFFLKELDKFSGNREFRHTLHETENKLIEEGIINRGPLKGSAKIAYLWKRSRRTIAVAASIAGVISLLSAVILASMNIKDKEENIKPLVEKIRQQDQKLNKLDQKIGQINSVTPGTTPPIRPRVESRFRATGFMIDPSTNLIITNAHVLKEARNQLFIENGKGDQFAAEPVYISIANDLAILHVTDSNFKKPSTLPYSIRRTNAELGEQIFMLGFPKQEIVYGEGYISAKNGYHLDTIYCQLNTAANEGNSGSPVFNRKGEILGVISSMETNAEGVVFATKSSHIHQAMEEVRKLKGFEKSRLNSNSALKGLEREAQIHKLEEFVFMIKGN